ncbi:MAG: c-type cytochrome [Spirochaetes bacterium]|nr:c-type cytochrome [Spirochaetota bacterium]
MMHVRSLRSLRPLLPALLLPLFIGCGPKQALDPFVLKVFQPLPATYASKDHPSTPEKVALGRRLYFETRLSRGQDLSCQSCHPLDRYGADGKRLSPGHRGVLGRRNSPTVYNAAGQMAQFWDGRAATVEDQAMGPVLNPVEMAMPSGEEAVKILSSIPGYGSAFRTAFPGDAAPITPAHIGEAIGAFERELRTPSRWDRYLAGESGALTSMERAGLKTFLAYSCQTCHGGPLLGGNSFQKLGAVKPWPDSRDQGRFELTAHEADRMVFKVPPLRNVAKTAPYFHDGSVATLEEAVDRMAEHQTGKKMGWMERQFVVRFFGALTGEISFVSTPE